MPQYQNTLFNNHKYNLFTEIDTEIKKYKTSITNEYSYSSMKEREKNNTEEI